MFLNYAGTEWIYACQYATSLTNDKLLREIERGFSFVDLCQVCELMCIYGILRGLHPRKSACKIAKHPKGILRRFADV